MRRIAEDLQVVVFQANDGGARNRLGHDGMARLKAEVRLVVPFLPDGADVAIILLKQRVRGPHARGGHLGSLAWTKSKSQWA